MNYIKQLTHFFNKAATDENLSPTHISLFMALFQYWNQSRFAESIQIIRDDIMQLAKISSKATYHKAMAFLHQHKYINYQPSYNPYKGSLIEFFPECSKLNNTQQQSNNRHVLKLNTKPINEPINKLYNTNIINHNISCARNQKSKESMKLNDQVLAPEKEKISAQKEKLIPPQQLTVEDYFQTNNSNHQEANRFINYYTANGWLVGGRSPMKDWKAAARNWIANSINYANKNMNKGNSPNRANQLNSNNDKNYSEPF